MVQSKKLTVDSIRSSSLAMNLVKAPSEHLPASILSNQNICNMLRQVQQAVHSELHGLPLADPVHDSKNYEGQAQGRSSRPSIISTRHGDTVPFHGSIEEIDAVCTLIADLKASLHDDDVLSFPSMMYTANAHMTIESAHEGVTPEHYCDPKPDSAPFVRPPRRSSVGSSASIEKHAIVKTGYHQDQARWSTAAPVGACAGSDMRELSDLSSPPTMMREAPRASYVNREHARTSPYAQEAERTAHLAVAQCQHPATTHGGYPHDATGLPDTISSVSSCHPDSTANDALDSNDELENSRQNAHPVRTHNHETSGWKPSDADCDSLCTYQPTLLDGSSRPLHCPGESSGELPVGYSTCSLSQIRPATVRPPRPPPRQYRTSLSAPRAFFGASHPCSPISDDMIVSRQAHHSCGAALTRANVTLRQMSAVVGGNVPHATSDSSQSWSGSSAPSMVLSAAVHAFCASQGLASNPVASPSAGSRPTQLSAANLEGLLSSSEQIKAQSSGLIATPPGSHCASADWASGETAAPVTPPQPRAVLPPSNAIPGCQSSEPVQCDDPAESSRKVLFMHTQHAAIPKLSYDSTSSRRSMTTLFHDEYALCP